MEDTREPLIEVTKAFQTKQCAIQWIHSAVVNGANCVKQKYQTMGEPFDQQFCF